MYSRNDYRYYLENRLMHSDDFLAHYGVKGMKWKHHKLGVKELNTVIMRDQEAFYTPNGVDARRALRQGKKAQKAYDKTLLGKADKKTNGLATAPYRILRNKSRAKAEAKAREKRRNSNVIITERKNQKTGEKTTRNPKVEIVTSKDYKKKRSKRESKWNRKMQNYGREALKEIQ